MSEELKTEEVQPKVQPQIQPEIQEITAKEKPKEKDPKRVAAGKRLAAISQKAKEEKMRRLLESEANDGSWKQYILIAMGISVLGLASYKYFWKQQKKEESKMSEAQEFVHEKVHLEMSEAESPKTKKEESKMTQEQPKRKQRGKPISLFD